MKLVPVSKLFEVEYGVNLDLNKLEEVEKETQEYIPYVGRSAKNNGITAFVAPSPEKTPNPGMTISVAGGGSVMSCFLQEQPYYSGRDLFYLKPKIEMSSSTLLWYCTVLRLNKYKFSYGRQANRTLKELLIPDLSEVPDYISNHVLDENREANEMFNSILSDVKPLINKLLSSAKHERLDRIFKVDNGKALGNYTIFPDRIKESLIPVVRPSKWQSTSYKAGYVDPQGVPESNIYPSGSLYVSTNGAGSHTYAYVSVEEIFPNSDVAVLTALSPMSIEMKLAYATLITANRFRYSYGRKPKGERLKSLILPVL